MFPTRPGRFPCPRCQAPALRYEQSLWLCPSCRAMGDALAVGEYHALARPARTAADWAEVAAHYARLGTLPLQLARMFGAESAALLLGDRAAQARRRQVRRAWEETVLAGVSAAELLALAGLAAADRPARHRPRWDRGAEASPPVPAPRRNEGESD